MNQKDRHKKVNCLVCGRCMLSNNLKRHAKIHKDLLSLSDEQVKKELRKRHATQLEREAKRKRVEDIALEQGVSPPEEISNTQPLEKDDLREDLLKDNQLYLEKIELGKVVSSILDEGIIREESLTKERKLALDLYRRQCPRFDIANMELRIWQQQAIDLCENPTERQVIWITGRHGNEGKTWFQWYVETYFGFHRVARIDLRIKHANVCNVLKKRSLGSIDIFLFNDVRSVDEEERSLYRILEDIKDGQATASKYDNDNIRFKTPNTLMVFSNHYPKIKKLSRDRWQIFNANRDGLNDVTLQVMKMGQCGYDTQNNV